MILVTIAPPPPKEKEKFLGEPGGGRGGFNEGGFWDDGGHGSPGGAHFSERRYYTGMFIALAGVVMFFAAFTSAYVVRKGSSDDWQPTQLPLILWPNTLLLLASSVTLEKARRSLENPVIFQRWWSVTTVLGLLFLGGQLFAWRELVSRGVYAHTNPSSSFFYLLTGTHGVHLLGGVIALLYLFWKIRRQPVTAPKRTAVGVTTLYWHFMDGLWLYLLGLLAFWG